MNAYILSILKDIMAIDSPSGYTKEVIQYCQKEAENLGFETKLTNKGNLQIFVKGQDDYTIGFCAHVDTLGLMVRSIKENGTLAFTNVGGPIIPTLVVNIVVSSQEINKYIQERFFLIHLLRMFMKMLKTKKEHVIQCIFVLMKK